MGTRKNAATLTSTEKQNFIRAIKALKANGIYNQYVMLHVDAASHASPSTVSPSYRNAAHKGPAFHPWHRYYLYKFELELQKQVPGVTLPYWNWAADAANPQNSAIWASDFLGGNGDPADGYLVKTGPFAVGQWTIIDENGNPAGGLRRQFGQSSPTVPSLTEVSTAVNEVPYDRSLWDQSSSSSHRNRLEGWLNSPQLHNKVHRWVGQSMLSMASPNDPVFFLHHANVDRLWAQWQAQHPTLGYLPTSSGPPGHNLNDVMYPTSSTTPASVLNHTTLGYTYA
jgi:tyrosinase